MSRPDYNHKYYLKTKERYREARATSRKRMKNEATALLRELKSVPCTDCGIRYPYYVMDFDHLHNKKFQISRMVGMSLDRILAEVLKCEVVCANCHRERTYGRVLSKDDTAALNRLPG